MRGRAARVSGLWARTSRGEFGQSPRNAPAGSHSPDHKSSIPATWNRTPRLSPDFLSEFVLYALSVADFTILVVFVWLLGRNIVKLIVERRRGSGTFVAPPKIHFNKLMSYTEHMSSRGLPPRTRVLSAKLIEQQLEIAARLGLPATSHLVKIDRLRLTGDDPFALETVYLPAPEFADLISAPLGKNSLFATLLTMNPKPMNTIIPSALMVNNWIKVTKPWISV